MANLTRLARSLVFRRCYSSSKVPSMNVFDRETKKLQRNTAALDPDYKNYEYLFDEVGFRVADRVFDIKRSFDKVLDLGCSRGYVAKHLTKETVKKLYMLEMAEKLLEKAEVPEEGVDVEKRVHDEETTLPFENESLDLVVSNLNIHWVNDLPRLFKDVMRCLKKDGAFIGSMFANDNLFELRVSLQLAELERRGGLAPHLSPLTTPQDIGALLNSSGFSMLTLDLDEITISYPTMFELLYDLKGMGENNCAWNRNLKLSKDTLLAAQSVYKEMYGNEDGSIPASFQVLFFIAWKPHESQKKPAKRGSGEVSFKDLNKLDEIIDNKNKIKNKHF